MVSVALLARSNDGEGVKSGPIGLAVILVLCVAVYFLFKSMSKHLRRVREEFPTDEPSSPQHADRAPLEGGSQGSEPQAVMPPEPE